MNQQAFDFLTALASKMETTAEHLWGVLVTQAVVSGVLDLVTFSLAVITLTLSFFFLRDNLVKIERSLGGHKISEGNVETVTYEILWFCWGASAVIVVLFGFIGAGWTLSKIINPEYAALMALKGF